MTLEITNIVLFIKFDNFIFVCYEKNWHFYFDTHLKHEEIRCEPVFLRTEHYMKAKGVLSWVFFLLLRWKNWSIISVIIIIPESSCCNWCRDDNWTHKMVFYHYTSASENVQAPRPSEKETLKQLYMSLQLGRIRDHVWGIMGGGSLERNNPARLNLEQILHES
jgi:hypothetical protein